MNGLAGDERSFIAFVGCVLVKERLRQSFAFSLSCRWKRCREPSPGATAAACSGPARARWRPSSTCSPATPKATNKAWNTMQTTASRAQRTDTTPLCAAPYTDR
eukprot:scaffold65392_cov28-Prasinocladus_malaysianus.AAC.1